MTKNHDEQVAAAADKIPTPAQALGRNEEDRLMNFSQVLQALRSGDQNGFSREGWNGNGIFIRAQFPDENSLMGNPYLYIDATALGGKKNPWVPSQTDMFADDWFRV